MPVPRMGTPEWDKEVEFYLTAPQEDIIKRAEQLGMMPGSYQRRMSERGIRRGCLHPEVIPLDQGLSRLEEQVLRIVQKEATSVGEISRQVDRSEDTVRATIDGLRAKGYEVILDEVRHQVSIPQEPIKEFEPTSFEYFKRTFRIGLVSDTHIGSIYQQMTLLYDAYADFDRRRVDFVLHGGDLGAGVGVYRGQDVEIFLHDPLGKEQTQYIVDKYPKLESGAKTYIIGGQHDRIYWKLHGYNIIRAVCEQRKDLVDRGFFQASFKIRGLPIELQHPGGGLAYAQSYKPQKIIESVAGYILSTVRASESLKKQVPALMVFGHYHVPLHLVQYMGVDGIVLACFEAQTPHLQQLGKMPIVGYAIAEITLDKRNNLSSSKVEFVIMNSQIKERDY